MVRVARLERAASTSQMWRPTNWATPGYSISIIIPRRGRKSKIFLSVVIYVVKAPFVPFSARGRNPTSAGAARLCGVSPCPVPDTATALPKQARYQLRYTRIRETLYRISREKAIEISLGFAFWDGGWYNGRKRRDDAWKRRVSFARRS